MPSQLPFYFLSPLERPNAISEFVHQTRNPIRFPFSSLKPVHPVICKMESDNIQDDRGICADVPLTDANVLRDRDINSAAVAAGQGKTSAKLVAGVYACPLDGKGAESKTESSVACPDDGVQLHEEYMAETIALLSDAVRTQLSLADSKEEESATDATGFEDINAEKSPDDGGEDGKATKSDNDGNNSGTLQVSSTLTDDTKSEPFPDYYESCEKNPQLIDKEREEAYNYAISKVVEEVIRFREVDASITDLPSPDSQIFGMTDYISGGQGAGSSGGNTPAEEWRPASRSEIHRVASFNDMTRILSRSDLKPNLRQRFIGITNMVVRMEHLLFRQHRSMPDDLILTNRDLWELNVMATETVRYLSILGNKLQDLVDDAYRVAFILNEISKDKVSSLTRYQRMAQVVMESVSSPTRSS